MKTLNRTILLLVFSFALSGATFAQTALMSGTVSDPNGAAISGANITARRSAEVFTTTTDAQGAFLFVNLSGGNYLLTVNASGKKRRSESFTAVKIHRQLCCRLRRDN